MSTVWLVAVYAPLDAESASLEKVAANLVSSCLISDLITGLCSF